MLQVKFELGSAHGFVREAKVMHKLLHQAMVVKVVPNVLSVHLNEIVVTFSLQNPFKQAVESMVFNYFLFLEFFIACVVLQHFLMD